MNGCACIHHIFTELITTCALVSSIAAISACLPQMYHNGKRFYKKNCNANIVLFLNLFLSAVIVPDVFGGAFYLTDFIC